MNIAVVTTFPNNSWDIYSKKMLQTFVQYWPAEIPLMVQLDDDLLYQEVDKVLRPQDGIAVGWEKEHVAFVERNKHKDDPQNYRFQAVRFCHKVFAIKRSLDASIKAKAAGSESARYLIWMDADVHTTKPVTMGDLKKCLPNDGEAVAYLGRKNWDHSECGWLAFDLESSGNKIIETVFNDYITDNVFNMKQWHDSWIWDRTIPIYNGTNISPEAKGLEAWPSSPMTDWSVHYKGPEAKAILANQPIITPQTIPKGRVVIQTKNAIPAEEICAHIEENQALITKWVRPCTKNDEEVVIVSAGPMMIPEDLRQEKGKKIIAVKHAIEPLKKAGVDIWATILLDPRPHVYDFVQEPDTSIIWFVASQVDPKVTRHLIDKGCNVWGYHAAVNANEAQLIAKQQYAVISGGSATATRGIYLLNHLGFKNFKLYGYDLCVFDKPDFNARDENGQPKFFEISVDVKEATFAFKRCFWTEPQLLAQFEEFQEMIKLNRFNITAIGDGIVPFIIKASKLADLRNKENVDKIGKITHYGKLLKCPTSLTSWQAWLPRVLRKLTAESRY